MGMNPGRPQGLDRKAVQQIADSVRKRLKLNWVRTWPDRPRDFCCLNLNGERVGRMYFREGSGMVETAWVWFLNGEYRDRQLCRQGHHEDKQDAAEELEAAWFSAVERIDRELGSEAAFHEEGERRHDNAADE